MAVNIVGDQKHHHHTVYKRAGRADGHQRIHVGIPVEQCLKAVDKEIPPAVEHRDRQHQLQNGEVHGVGVHGKQIRQRQGGQSEGQHLPHGHIQQSTGKDSRNDQFPLFSPQFQFLRVLAGLDRSRFLRFLMELGPEARLLHLGDDLLRRHLRFVVDDGHALRHQIHVAALYPRQPPGHFFHGRAACGAVHPGNVIYFFPHGGSSFETVNCFPVDLSPNRHSYFVCIIYPHGVFVK